MIRKLLALARSGRLPPMGGGALDALCVKSIAVNSAATFYPTGANESGGAAADEFWVYSGPIGQPLEVGILVPSQAGTTPTLDASVEWSDSASFATILHTATLGPQITAADTFPLRRAVHMTSRATYGRVKLVAGGTSPDFGTVTAWMGAPQSHHQRMGATYD